MKRSSALLSLGLILLSLGTAGAQDSELDCASPVTQTDMNICAIRDYEAADALLNAVYKEAFARTRAIDRELAEIGHEPTGALDALREGQRGWIAYRDGHCELAGFDARGGSLESLLVSTCMAEFTRLRTRELRAWLDSQDAL